MTEPVVKRRRQAYNKLICTGCRARRIRCTLPDPTVQPSSQPQPPDKACTRCRNNGLDCIVDFTTLGRPAQKRSRAVEFPANASQQQQQQGQYAATGPFSTAKSTVDVSPSFDVDDFLLTKTDSVRDDAQGDVPLQVSRLSKSELCDSMTNSYHLLSAMLARDKKFASSIGSQPLIEMSILELIDDATAALLDEHLVWHKVHYPAIPSLPNLRTEVSSFDTIHPQRTSGIFLLTLLCDLALDVPSARLEGVRSLQPAVRALLYHNGQKLFFSLSRNAYTILALSLTTQYRPLSLTSSQVASSHTLKALPHMIMEKYVATELGFSASGSRLLAALKDPITSDDELKPLINQCRDWVRLSVSEDLQNGIFGEWTRRIDPSAIECLDALRAGAESRRMPVDMLLPYSSLLYGTQALANLRDMTEHWKDLHHLEEVINGHRVFCDRERDTVEQLLEPFSYLPEVPSVISHIADMERHNSHLTVVGTALFFSIMCGTHAATHTGSIQLEQAMGVSDNIINQLRSQEKTDPNRTDCRKFLETYGEDRMDQLERALSNFISAADTLRLHGIPFIARTRDTVGWMIVMCKDIVENNAARLKGWGGLDDRVDVQMILFSECARRLEAMSASAGTDEALAKGCLLTAAAKLIRSLHRILQGFKKRVAALSKRGSSSEMSGSTAIPTPRDEGLLSAVGTSSTASSGWDDVLADDVLSDWANWPQLDSLDFAEIFGNLADFGAQGYGDSL